VFERWKVADMGNIVRLGLLLAGLVLLTAATGEAREPQRLIGDAVWKYRPDGEQFASLYPGEAQSPQRAGWAVVSCRARASGMLEDCKVAAEAPLDLGFGKSAVALAEKYFRLEAKTKSGESVEGGYVHIPIVYQGLGGVAEAAPGRPSMLVTPAKERTAGSSAFPCPTPENAQTLCLAHQFYWKTQPDIELTAPILRTAGQTTGISILDCLVGNKGKLTDCQVQGDVTPDGKAAILKLATTFEAPDRTQDKTPTINNGRIAALFDWAAILKANEVLAPIDAPP
jgi:hypothetical protein